MQYELFMCADKVCVCVFQWLLHIISVGTPGSLTPTVKSPFSPINYITVLTFTCRKKHNQMCLCTPLERVTKDPHVQVCPKGGSIEFYNGARRQD